MRGDGLTRRELLRRGAALGAGVALGAGRWGSLVDIAGAATGSAPKPPRKPGSLPRPRQPVGTPALPQIEHILVVMMENHSFDNYLGMLGRGDGFRLAKKVPTNSNPDGKGSVISAFHMPSTCQLDKAPGQNWNASHTSYDGGRNDGFVRASGPVAMGYWTGDDIPFYYELARTFPLCDRWFGSCMAQTYPNRRFLMAGTAYGNVTTDVKDILAPSPPNGTIFDQLNAHGISWRNYFTDLPQVGLFKEPLNNNPDKIVKIDQFFVDAKAGTLPGVAFVDPNFDKESEENNNDIQLGEAFVSRVVQATMESPAWPKTVLIWCYDEHGGYYDHVPPPPAIKPDDVPPDIHVPPDQPGGYDRYGFRVPAVVVSPYAKRDYVSHVVHDHTSILKLIETKWNLPALTYRDANADDLLDCLDLSGRPAFRDPPKLPPPGQMSHPSNCTPGKPGQIPPADAVHPAPSTSKSTSTTSASSTSTSTT